MHITEQGMSIRKGHVLYDATSMTFWKRQNDGDTKKISSCQGLGEGGRDERGGARRILRSVKLSVCCCDDGDGSDTFVQTHWVFSSSCKLWTLTLGDGV